MGFVDEFAPGPAMATWVEAVAGRRVGAPVVVSAGRAVPAWSLEVTGISGTIAPLEGMIISTNQSIPANAKSERPFSRSASEIERLVGSTVKGPMARRC